MKDRERVDRMSREYVCQFRNIPVDIRVKFRAEYYHNFALQKIAVEVCEGKGDTIRGDKEICIIEVGGTRVQEFQLYRPLPQF